MQLHSEAQFLLQMPILIAGSYVIWNFTGIKKFFPLVVVQIFCSLILGYSVLGHISPEVYHFLFPESSLPLLQGISYLALVFFGFLTGLHLETEQVVTKGKGFLLTSVLSVFIPFLFCSVFGWFVFQMFPEFVGEKANIVSYSMAVGIIGSVTALPVLGAVIKEMHYLHRPVGQIALNMATVNDVFLWLLVAVLTTLIQNTGSGFLSIGMTLVYILLYFTVMMFVARPFLAYLIRKGNISTTPSYSDMVFIATFVCLSAFTTDIIGVHYLLGAFLAGVVIPKEIAHGIRDILKVFVKVVLLPFFFMLTGIKTDFNIASSHIWYLFIGIMLVSTFAKVLSVALPARFTLFHTGEYPWKRSFVLGIFMQTKGLMEITILSILLQASVITDSAFAAFLLMALLATALTQPVILIIEHFYPQKSISLK